MAVLVACAVSGFAACSQILGIQSDRYVDAGVAETSTPDVGGGDVNGGDAGGGDAGIEAGPWSCLGQPPQVFSPTATSAVTLLAIDGLQPITQAQVVDGGSALDILSYAPIPGLSVRACSTILHPLCDQGTGTAYQTTDDAGKTTFQLLQSWNGFFQINTPGYFTTALYPGSMIAGETQTTLPGIILGSTAEAELEAVLTGVTLSHEADGGVGHVLVSIYDCQDHFAPGVQIVPGSSVDAGPYLTTVFYTQGSGGQEIPTTTTDSTDAIGAGGILNAPTGSFLVTAKLKATGQTVGSLALFVSPGTATQVTIRARTQ